LTSVIAREVDGSHQIGRWIDCGRYGAEPAGRVANRDRMTRIDIAHRFHRADGFAQSLGSEIRLRYVIAALTRRFLALRLPIARPHDRDRRPASASKFTHHVQHRPRTGLGRAVDEDRQWMTPIVADAYNDSLQRPDLRSADLRIFRMHLRVLKQKAFRKRSAFKLMDK